MGLKGSERIRRVLIWFALALAAIVPLGAAATSPLLAWRDPTYIAAGFAGVFAMVLLLVQPLLAVGYLPGLEGPRGRRIHRWIGAGLVMAVAIHVAGLWITSPPDVIDALLFRSPTPFSAWGVVAMWSVIAVALLAVFRRQMRVRPRVWRRAHSSLAFVVVAGSTVHALLIDGTMETLSKVALCAVVLAVTATVAAGLWRRPGGSG